ncbi:4231_t:CDS:2 [Ambispora gerdemannii]|uniref:4231_t:CDS:1 n=1 Tax=Ambispora gerdemannii TaxID=144530 RepID=A0A9N9BUA9_9GLOM|nr:4231_t:CDS:2 [Ambispora gerdemannii]
MLASQLHRNIYSFWFKGFKNGAPLTQDLTKTWFGGGEVDNYCRANYAAVLEDIRENRSYIEEMKQSPEYALTLTILLDQFPRNIYRKTAIPFRDFDPLALQVAHYAINYKFDEKLNAIERLFLYMAKHSESNSDQESSVEKFKWNHETALPLYAQMTKSFYEYAKSHKSIIDQFGRFPHRNNILGRESSIEEIEFLKTADFFGQ